MHPPMFDPHTSADCTGASSVRSLVFPQEGGLSGCSAAEFPLPLSSSCNPYRNTVALRGFKELEELKSACCQIVHYDLITPRPKGIQLCLARAAFPSGRMADAHTTLILICQDCGFKAVRRMKVVSLEVHLEVQVWLHRNGKCCLRILTRPEPNRVIIRSLLAYRSGRCTF